jgi:hypothetical protein
MFDTHEAPCRVPVPVSVITAACREDALDSIRAYYLNFDVTTTVMSNPNPHSDVLQCFKIVLIQVFLGYRDSACDTIRDDGQSIAHFSIQSRRAVPNLHSR